MTWLVVPLLVWGKYIDLLSLGLFVLFFPPGVPILQRGGIRPRPWPVQSISNSYTTPLFSKWRKIWIWDVFWSQHLGCWGQNTSRIQNKGDYATCTVKSHTTLSHRARSYHAPGYGGRGPYSLNTFSAILTHWYTLITSLALFQNGAQKQELVLLPFAPSTVSHRNTSRMQYSATEPHFVSVAGIQTARRRRSASRSTVHS